jgi:hypothetical protein
MARICRSTIWWYMRNPQGRPGYLHDDSNLAGRKDINAQQVLCALVVKNHNEPLELLCATSTRRGRRLMETVYSARCGSRLDALF